MKKNLAFSLLFFIGIANAQWAREPSTILGVKLGQPLIASNLPDCPIKSYEATVPCLITASVRGPNGAPLYSVGGHPFTYASVSILTDGTGVVSQLKAWMKQEKFSEFRDALFARYGLPSKQSNENVQTRSGAVYPNQTAVWQGVSVNITALERFGKIDESVVIFSDNAAIERFGAQRKNRLNEAASKL